MNDFPRTRAGKRKFWIHRELNELKPYKIASRPHLLQSEVAQIIQLRRQGMPINEVARIVGRCRQTVIRYTVKILSREERLRVSNKNLNTNSKDERNAAIVAARLAGASQRDIAKKFGIHRVCVRTICQRYIPPDIDEQISSRNQSECWRFPKMSRQRKQVSND